MVLRDSLWRCFPQKCVGVARVGALGVLRVISGIVSGCTRRNQNMFFVQSFPVAQFKVPGSMPKKYFYRCLRYVTSNHGLCSFFPSILEKLVSGDISFSTTEYASKRLLFHTNLTNAVTNLLSSFTPWSPSGQQLMSELCFCRKNSCYSSPSAWRSRKFISVVFS